MEQPRPSMAKAVASLTVERASTIAAGMDLDKLDFMAGPRYTIDTNHWTNNESAYRSSGLRNCSKSSMISRSISEGFAESAASATVGKGSR